MLTVDEISGIAEGSGYLAAWTRLERELEVLVPDSPPMTCPVARERVDQYWLTFVSGRMLDAEPSTSDKSAFLLFSAIRHALAQPEGKSKQILEERCENARATLTKTARLIHGEKSPDGALRLISAAISACLCAIAIFSDRSQLPEWKQESPENGNTEESQSEKPLLEKPLTRFVAAALKYAEFWEGRRQERAPRIVASIDSNQGTDGSPTALARILCDSGLFSTLDRRIGVAMAWRTVQWVLGDSPGKASRSDVDFLLLDEGTFRGATASLVIGSHPACPCKCLFPDPICLGVLPPDEEWRRAFDNVYQNSKVTSSRRRIAARGWFVRFASSETAEEYRDDTLMRPVALEGPSASGALAALLAWHDVLPGKFVPIVVVAAISCDGTTVGVLTLPKLSQHFDPRTANPRIKLCITSPHEDAAHSERLREAFLFRFGGVHFEQSAHVNIIEQHVQKYAASQRKERIRAYFHANPPVNLLLLLLALLACGYIFGLRFDTADSSIERIDVAEKSGQWYPDLKIASLVRDPRLPSHTINSIDQRDNLPPNGLTPTIWKKLTWQLDEHLLPSDDVESIAIRDAYNTSAYRRYYFGVQSLQIPQGDCVAIFDCKATYVLLWFIRGDDVIGAFSNFDRQSSAHFLHGVVPFRNNNGDENLSIVVLMMPASEYDESRNEDPRQIAYKASVHVQFRMISDL